MIVLFGGEKGGTGKSTMAVIQAAMRALKGRDVALVDADGQKSALKWAAIRTEDKIEPAITCFALYGNTLAEQIRGLAGKFDDIVIDTRGADAPELRSAMLVADVLVTPGQPSQFDLFTLATMDRLVRDARSFNPKLQARILVNQAPTNAASTEAEDMRQMCAELDEYTLLQTTVKSRKAYRQVAKEGRACHEADRPDEKAIAEMEQLSLEIWQ